MNEPLGAALELRQVVRTFRQAGAPLPVLRGASLVLRPGEIVAAGAGMGVDDAKCRRFLPQIIENTR